ncbi:MAG: L-dopachrome tautomerase-related protein [Burkholderiaceae bacterium]
MKLSSVATSDTIVNGVAVSSTGRIFCSLPRWSVEQSASVAEVDAGGQLVPYPDARWNTWNEGLAPEDRFVMAHSVYVDDTDQLWVVDDGSPFFEPYIPGAPKVVQIDVRSNRVVKVYSLGPEVLPPRALLGHLRRHGDHLFITESHGRAIIVLDLRDGSTRRVLGTHASTAADPSIVPCIDGHEFRKASTGKPQVIHVNLLEVSHDDQWLYFCPLFGPRLSRAPIALLVDPQVSDEELGRSVETVASIPPLAGITRAPSGGFYLCSITENAILHLETDGRLRSVIRDERISFPNEPSVGPDGALYFPSSQVHRLPLFHTDGQSRVQLPFRIFRLEP